MCEEWDVSVSVIIPHFGDPQPTLDLVSMLRHQDTSHDIELIIVDDCSPEPFPSTAGATILRRETNGGFGTAVNTGARRASHGYLLVLNSDLVIDDSFVECLLSSAQPWLPAVVSPWVTSPDGRTSWIGRHFPTMKHQFVEWLTPLARWRERMSWHEAVGHDTTATGESSAVVDWVVGAALLVPTAEFRAVGGFDERFFMNSEEADLQRRLRSRGVPSVVLPTPHALHEGGGSSDPDRRRAWLVHSRLTYAAKWGHRRRLVGALTVATGINFGWNVARRALGRPVHPLLTLNHELSLLRQKS